MKPIPEQTLRRVFQRMRETRPHWPATYNEATADPVIARIVETMARHEVPAFARRDASRSLLGLWQSTAAVARGQQEQAPPDWCGCPQGVCEGTVVKQAIGRTCRLTGGPAVLSSATYPQAQRTPIVKRQPGIDFKSRAAGEKDEPDDTTPMPFR